MVSLDPEISILLIVLVLSEVPSCPKNDLTYPNIRGREDRKKFSLDWKVSKISSKEYIKNHLFFLNDVPYRRQCTNIRIYKCVCSHFLPFFALFSTSHHLHGMWSSVHVLPPLRTKYACTHKIGMFYMSREHKKRSLRRN